jgi:hypothetical protein
MKSRSRLCLAGSGPVDSGCRFMLDHFRLLEIFLTDLFGI